MNPPRPKVSPLLVDRELNGTILLTTLHELRADGVTPTRLAECDAWLEGLAGLDPVRAGDHLTQLAMTRLADVPPLARLLVRWAPRLRLAGDVPLFRAYFRRLALLSALIPAVWEAGARLGTSRGAP